MHSGPALGADDISFISRLPRAEIILTERLILAPLRVDHAASMVRVLSHPSIYRFTGGEAPTHQQLSARYRRQTEGHSTDGTQGWLNWVVTLTATGESIGFVQATVHFVQKNAVADVAWVIAPPWQERGIASEATTAMVNWLRSQGITHLTAHIHPENAASIAVARRQELTQTADEVDGEVSWVSRISGNA